MQRRTAPSISFKMGTPGAPGSARRPVHRFSPPVDVNPNDSKVGQVALVTGASSGLGQALAEALAGRGWRVGLVARRDAMLESVAVGIRDRGGEALVLPCDVRDRAQVFAAADACRAGLGPIDLLVANAGMSGSTHFRQPGFHAGVEEILSVNFLGAVYALDAVLPEMLDRGAGHVVAMGSLAGYRGLPLSAAYSASKAAMANFFESLRLDLRGTGVDVTLLRPGYVRTPLTDQNDHRMPWLVDLDDATARMMAAIERRDRSYQFPWPLARAAWLAQLLPDRLYDYIASKVRREKRE